MKRGLGFLFLLVSLCFNGVAIATRTGSYGIFGSTFLVIGIALVAADRRTREGR